jgi:[ribosomal protein S5]-alanine N-acetyltransferase
MGEIFDFSYFPVIVTERLRLRQLTRDDANALAAIFGSPDVLRFLNNPPIDTREKALKMIGWLDDRYKAHEAVDWGITLHDSDELIGGSGFYLWDRESHHVDIGYHFLPTYWGRGYATEATRAMIAWCFDNLAVHRIQADCTDGNIASEKVLLKCGFKVEGIWRESCWEHGRFVDIKQFGLLRREYSC